MREIGLACIVLGLLFLAFPLYDHLVHFISLRAMQAQLLGGLFLTSGGFLLALSPR